MKQQESVVFTFVKKRLLDGDKKLLNNSYVFSSIFDDIFGKDASNKSLIRFVTRTLISNWSVALCMRHLNLTFEWDEKHALKKKLRDYHAIDM